jgi:hypothetical protein
MRIAAGAVLRLVWALAGFAGTLFAFGRHPGNWSNEEGTTVLLALSLAAAGLCAVLGPRLYRPDHTAGAGTLDKVRRMSGRGGLKRDRK